MRARPEIAYLVLGLGIALLFGCGGGGGGSDSSSSGLTYTGPATAAVIATSEDVSKLTTEALNGANSVTFDPGADVVNAEYSRFTQADLAQTLTQLGDLARPTASQASRVPFSDTITGPCGGTGTLSGTNNSLPGQMDVQGTLSFSNFCVIAADGQNILINGSLDFAMSGTSSSYLFTMSSGRLSITIGGASYVYALNYSCRITGGTAGQVTLTATYLAPDGKTYRIENYQVAVDAAVQTVQISGRLYHPDYGYVDVTTPVIITYSDCGGVYRPISGTLRVTGDGGHYGEFVGGGCNGYSLCLDAVCVPYNW